jgi:hypothetical protein
MRQVSRGAFVNALFGLLLNKQAGRGEAQRDRLRVEIDKVLEGGKGGKHASTQPPDY